MTYDDSNRFEVVKTRTCVDCKNTFDITQGEKTFFEEKGYTLPSRCKSCRQKRRLQREQQV